MNHTFSVNLYDKDGDILEEGIFLHIGDITTIKFKDVSELDDFTHALSSTVKEIRENY